MGPGDNEQARRRGQKERDASEIRCVELERIVTEGMTLIERRDSVAFFRDQAADHFARHTCSVWRPRSGSMVNHRTLTSTMINSRDVLAARRRADNDMLLRSGDNVLTRLDRPTIKVAVHLPKLCIER
jgi:hypothetical protein